MDVNKRDSRCSSREMPNNYSEQFSDSNGMSMSHTIKTAHSPCEDENTPNVQNTENNSIGRDGGDIDTLGSSSSGSCGPSANLSSPNSKKSSLSKQVSLSKINSNISSSKAIRDEQDIKKEDASLSPVSPLGFASGSGQSNCDADDMNGPPTLIKTTNLSPLSGEKGVQFPRSGGCSDLEDRPASASLIPGNGNSSNLDNCANLNTSISPKSQDGFVSNVSNMPRNFNPFNGNLTKFNCSTQQEIQGLLNSSGNVGGGGGGNEYMQQQNHVFVFSTQLANKSAEAVIGGQFPTIIAYHCMQPSTKLFLEDFLKNPAKTSKMQRQYSLNIMNVMQSGSSAGGPGLQPYWLNECNNSGKLSHRLALRNAGPNKSNPGWDQTTDQGCPATNPLDILNNTESFDNTKAGLCIKIEDKSNIPSLQGVKVPDENLTPQQRQHREEQLAKLKKMNKFLFPENEGHDFHPGHLTNTAPPPSETVGSLAGNTGDMLQNNSASNCSDGPNKMYQTTMRNMPGNLGKPTGHLNANHLDGVPGLTSDSIIHPDLMATVGGEAAMQSNKHGCVPKMNNSNLNMVKSRGSCDANNEPINNAVLENSPDMVTSFNLDNCPSSETESIGGPSNMNMPQEEWNKFQNNSFQDSFKNRHSNVINNSTGAMVCQQNPSLSRSLSIGGAAGGYAIQQARPNTGASPNNRNNNGPPPPYHQTQRSASVPIATQSPNHTNANNPNAEMPLPSPQGSRAPFGSSTPPTNEVTNSSSTALTNSTHSVTTSLSGITSGNIMSNALLNSMSSNPSHTLPHISPREMDCSIENVHKLKRSSPQKFKGPPINDMPDNTESKYANFALNYPTCGGMPPVGPPNMRMQQMPSQFCRRIDMSSNIPLNPNNRISQNKTSGGFDPISSLAQMSQQLTGCGVGLSSIGGGAGNSITGGGIMDVNNSELMAHSGRSNDHSLDHCNQISNANNIGMVGMGGGPPLGRPGQFPSDINNMLCGETVSMDQRMLNGKMCMPPGHFNHNSLTGVGLGGNDMMPSNRSIRRMPGNFDNFNMSSNVHVRASAPNTIQYMPARSQNLNNMRVPPSIEFFQRYSNPHQMMGNVAGHPTGHDMSNPNILNIFGNCNQMSTGGMGLSGGFEPNDLEVDGNLIHNDDYMNVR